MPQQCYHAGDFWQCLTSTTDSPTTSPAKWRKVAIPAEWRKALTHLTQAYLLEGQRSGQLDKATVQRNKYKAELGDLVDLPPTRPRAS